MARNFKFPHRPVFSVVISLSVVSFLVCASFLDYPRTAVFSHVPENWPKTAYNFRKKPLNPEVIDLGRVLFYDPVLSSDSTISCASCHSPYTAFTHIDHKTSHGILDRIGPRNSPALVNLAWSESFMWDGAVARLDEQAQFPIENPDEMGEDMEHVLMKLNRQEKYRAVFKRIYDSDKITREQLLSSLSQFMLTLVSSNSKYDKVMRGEPNVFFSADEEKGLALFRKNCASCHAEPLFTNFSFQNNGLAADEKINDKGRMAVTGKPADAYKFKVPTLRNIERTAPYMHDGRFRSLQMVLFHYSAGIIDSPTLSPALKGKVQLSEQEKGQLISFLKTLTDNSFLTDSNHQFKQF